MYCFSWAHPIHTPRICPFQMGYTSLSLHPSFCSAIQTVQSKFKVWGGGGGGACYGRTHWSLICDLASNHLYLPLISHTSPLHANILLFLKTIYCQIKKRACYDPEDYCCAYCNPPLPTVIRILQYNILHPPPPTHSNTHIAIYMSISIGYSTGQCIGFSEPTPIHTPRLCPFQMVKHLYPYTPPPPFCSAIHTVRSKFKVWGATFPVFRKSNCTPLRFCSDAITGLLWSIRHIGEILFWRHHT